MAPAVKSVWATLCYLPRGLGLLPAAGCEDNSNVVNNCRSSASLRCRTWSCVTAASFPVCLHLSIPQLAASVVWAKVSPSLCSRLCLGFLTRQPMLGCDTPVLVELRAICESQVLQRDAGAPGAVHREPTAAETI